MLTHFCSRRTCLSTLWSDKSVLHNTSQGTRELILKAVLVLKTPKSRLCNVTWIHLPLITIFLCWISWEVPYSSPSHSISPCVLEHDGGSMLGPLLAVAWKSLYRLPMWMFWRSCIWSCVFPQLCSLWTQRSRGQSLSRNSTELCHYGRMYNAVQCKLAQFMCRAEGSWAES